MTGAETGPERVIEQDTGGVDIHFPEPCWVLSSCVLNGGLVRARRIINRTVAGLVNSGRGRDGPAETLLGYHRDRGWQGITVGMMTAASMDSLRRECAREGGVAVETLVTTGLTNAMRAGEKATWREGEEIVGTINIICLVNRRMPPQALTEAVMVVTEAKTVALAEHGVISPQSGRLATGTGTDAIAVVSGNREPEISYCGKHVPAGELLARTTIMALGNSLEWYLKVKSRA